MAEKKFSGAPFGTQTARFDVTGVHPNTKVPGTFTQIPYDKPSTQELGVQQKTPSKSEKLQTFDMRLKNIRADLVSARSDVDDMIRISSNLSLSRSCNSSSRSSIYSILSQSSKVQTGTSSIQRSSLDENELEETYESQSKQKRTLCEDKETQSEESKLKEAQTQDTGFERIAAESLDKVQEAGMKNFSLKKAITFEDMYFEDSTPNPLHPRWDSCNLKNCMVDGTFAFVSEEEMDVFIQSLQVTNKKHSKKHSNRRCSSVDKLVIFSPPKTSANPRNESTFSPQGAEVLERISKVKGIDVKQTDKENPSNNISYIKDQNSSNFKVEADGRNSSNIKPNINTEDGNFLNSKSDNENDNFSNKPITEDENSSNNKPNTGENKFSHNNSKTEVHNSSTRKSDEDAENSSNKHRTGDEKISSKQTKIKEKNSPNSKLKIYEENTPNSQNKTELQNKSNNHSLHSISSNSLNEGKKRNLAINEQAASNADVLSSDDHLEKKTGSKVVFGGTSNHNKPTKLSSKGAVKTKSSTSKGSKSIIANSRISLPFLRKGPAVAATRKALCEDIRAVIKIHTTPASQGTDKRKAVSKTSNIQAKGKALNSKPFISPKNKTFGPSPKCIEVRRKEQFTSTERVSSSNMSVELGTGLRKRLQGAYAGGCDTLLRRKMGPGAYNTIVGGFSNKSVEARAAGPGWGRQLEVERLAALPHLLFKEQWEENKMLKRKLGPGSYEIKDFIQRGNEKPRSGRGICDNLAPRFEKSQQSTTPGPGTYGIGGVPQRAMEFKDFQSTSTKGMLDKGDRKRTLPSVGSHLGPGTYRHKTCTEELLNKVTSLKGPYKLYSGDRNKPITEGYLAAPQLADLGPGQYEIGSFVDELNSKERRIHGKFGKMAQYPEVPTDRLFLFSQAHCNRRGVPGPGAYSMQELSTPTAVNSPGFLSSAKRDDKMSQKFFTRNFNPVGAGRYDIQKFDEAQDLNGHSSVFKSKTGKPNLQMAKFLQERIRSKDVKVEDRVVLSQPHKMTRSITVM